MSPGNVVGFPRSPSLPFIVLRPGETHLAAERALELLIEADLPWVVSQGDIYEVGELPANPKDYPRFYRITPALLRIELAKLAIWQRESPSGKKLTRIDPPAAVANMILAVRQAWPWRRCGALPALDPLGERDL